MTREQKTAELQPFVDAMNAARNPPTSLDGSEPEAPGGWARVTEEDHARGDFLGKPVGAVIRDQIRVSQAHHDAGNFKAYPLGTLIYVGDNF
jgi:hypothetical protein